MAVIALGNGTTITTFPVPSSNFDPLTASPADLARFGFPRRPDEDAHLLARYQSVFQRLKGKFKYIEPTFKVDTTKRTHIQPAKETAGTESSPNWSGGVVYAPQRQSFAWVQGAWVCPNVYAPTQNEAYYNVSWIGIDGDGSGDVCQAGMVCEVTNNSRTINPWHEWFPSSWVNITNLTVNPGDLISVLICTQGAGSTSAGIYFANLSSGVATSYTITAPAGTKLVGNSAEWIVETPGINNVLAPMPDYGEVFFSNCEAGLSNGTTVNGGTGNNINLVQNGQTLSTGTLITPTIIECQYTGPAPVQAPATYSQITFNIGTGGDDLRGDSSATASVVLPGGTQTFTLKAQTDPGWANNSDHVKTFTIAGAAQPLSAFGAVTITLTSHNSFGETDDNWNIQSVNITVNGSSESAVVVNQSGDPLARLTGSAPSVTLQPVAGA